MRDTPELTQFVKDEAVRLGFSLVGITTPDPPPHLDVLEKWLKNGRHGEMGYLATDRSVLRRSDPRQILPECRSIVILGANYLPTEAPAPGIAAYAAGDDYHEVLVERMKRLVASLEAEVGQPIGNRYYTDTGPLLERELAQRAGLGWIGKNTCLINPQRGSYFLLAELLLELELVPDEPITTDHCGDCMLCIEACPTACILPDRTIDATRCISYLTIEVKGAIPIELRSETGHWIFGCDVCQQVCPWNVRFAAPSEDPAFRPRRFLQSVQPADVLALNDDRYRAELRGSPLKRAKRRGLVRNAALAAANSNEPGAPAALRRVLALDPEPLARGHAAWALGQFGDEAALRSALETESDDSVLAEIHSALERLA